MGHFYFGDRSRGWVTITSALTRLYAFVRYARRIEFTDIKRISITRAFFIALSSDQGKTWTFVDGEGMTPEKVHYILPSYTDHPLPETVWIHGATN